MLYCYAARSQDGRRVRGSIEASSSGAAVASLRVRALTVVEMETSTSPRGLWHSFVMALQRDSAAKTSFYRYAATMLSAGIPVHGTLLSYAHDCNDRPLKEALLSIGSAIDGGESLSKSLARHPREFDTLAVATIKAGEATGTIDSAFRSLASAAERNGQVRRRVRTALAYPAVVASMAIGLVLFLVRKSSRRSRRCSRRWTSRCRWGRAC